MSHARFSGVSSGSHLFACSICPRSSSIFSCRFSFTSVSQSSMASASLLFSHSSAARSPIFISRVMPLFRPSIASRMLMSAGSGP